MKINPYQTTINVNSYKKVNQGDGQNSSSNQTNSASKKDQVTISNEAKQLNQSTTVQTERQQKVEDLKNQVQNGQYTIQPQKVAQAFASYWQALGGK